MSEQTPKSLRPFRTMFSPGRDIHNALEEVAQHNGTTRQELLERAAKALIAHHHSVLASDPKAKKTVPAEFQLWTGVKGLPREEVDDIAYRVIEYLAKAELVLAETPQAHYGGKKKPFPVPATFNDLMTQVSRLMHNQAQDEGGAKKSDTSPPHK